MRQPETGLRKWRIRPVFGDATPIVPVFAAFDSLSGLPAVVAVSLDAKTGTGLYKSRIRPVFGDATPILPVFAAFDSLTVLLNCVIWSRFRRRNVDRCCCGCVRLPLCH
jgi:VIT1/CCC1 family predicted Fe2+/Mn2+ transporter